MAITSSMPEEKIPATACVSVAIRAIRALSASSRALATSISRKGVSGQPGESRYAPGHDAQEHTCCRDARLSVGAGRAGVARLRAAGGAEKLYAEATRQGEAPHGRCCTPASRGGGARDSAQRWQRSRCGNSHANGAQSRRAAIFGHRRGCLHPLLGPGTEAARWL